jgi:hypothetical protein
MIVGQGKNLTAEQIEAMLAEMEAEAFAAGERKGRIVGLREAVSICAQYWHTDVVGHINSVADTLEREFKP